MRYVIATVPALALSPAAVPAAMPPEVLGPLQDLPPPLSDGAVGKPGAARARLGESAEGVRAAWDAGARDAGLDGMAKAMTSMARLCDKHPD